MRYYKQVLVNWPDRFRRFQVKLCLLVRY